jgi:hypothetical protein
MAKLRSGQFGIKRAVAKSEIIRQNEVLKEGSNNG